MLSSPPSASTTSVVEANALAEVLVEAYFTQLIDREKLETHYLADGRLVSDPYLTSDTAVSIDPTRHYHLRRHLPRSCCADASRTRQTSGRDIGPGQFAAGACAFKTKQRGG